MIIAGIGETAQETAYHEIDSILTTLFDSVPVSEIDTVCGFVLSLVCEIAESRKEIRSGFAEEII